MDGWRLNLVAGGLRGAKDWEKSPDSLNTLNTLEESATTDSSHSHTLRGEGDCLHLVLAFGFANSSVSFAGLVGIQPRLVRVLELNDKLAVLRRVDNQLFVHHLHSGRSSPVARAAHHLDFKS